MRKRPEIPEDVFFNVAPAAAPAAAAAVEPEIEEPKPPPRTRRTKPEATPQSKPQAIPEDEVLQKTMGERGGRESYRPPRTPEPQRSSEALAAWEDEPEVEAEVPRIGRPPAQEGPKMAVTLYLTEPVAHLLEEVKFRLLTEYGVRTSKSAIADFAMRQGLSDLEAAAEDLRRD